MTASASGRDDDGQPEGVQRVDYLQADVRAEHVEGAVGQVENAHDPERQRKTGRQQEQDEGIGQPVEPCDECLAHSPPKTCRRFSPAALPPPGTSAVGGRQSTTKKKSRSIAYLPVSGGHVTQPRTRADREIDHLRESRRTVLARACPKIFPMVRIAWKSTTTAPSVGTIFSRHTKR